MSESCACLYSCSSGKLSWGSLQLQQRGPHRGMGPASLGMQRQRADSQIRCDRERRCSRRTPGRPPASLWGSRCPSSPRRRSSQRGEGERRKRRQAERRKVKVQQQDSIYVGLICVFQEDSRWEKKVQKRSCGGRSRWGNYVIKSQKKGKNTAGESRGATEHFKLTDH